MDRMARKLAARHGRRRRRYRRGKLHVGETVRRAIPTDGIPFHPRWRKIERKRLRSWRLRRQWFSSGVREILVDVSLCAAGRVTAYPSFAFSAALGEVSDLLATLPVEEAIERVNLKYGGATDYGRALQDFSELALLR